MSKIAKTIKISIHQENWLKSSKINFSEWVRKKLDEEIHNHLRLKTDSQFKAVILAAGKDTNLFPLTEEIPKTMLDIKGKTVLQRQVEMLREVGIKDIAVVRGYQNQQVSYPNLHYFDNENYENTGILVSLFEARDFMDCNTIVLYGDILFEIETLKRLLEEQNDNTLVVDRGWKKHYQDSKEKRPRPPELMELTNEGNEISINSTNANLPGTNSTSEFIGLAKLSIKACTILKDVYKNIYLPDPNRKFQNAKHIKKSSFVDFIAELLNRKEKVSVLEIWRTWIDIDTFEDYRNAWKFVKE
ncbi:phosphocholine cytidylyltransferase family protein [candidate division KSB1 bacterium]|nr:phosphocholine cytidylyltransferase family protein [candidate division KSB1 bacterium]